MSIERQVLTIRRLSDDALQASLRRVLGSNRKLVALLLAHLGEVEARRLHLLAGNESMFAYCTRRLGMSEDEACRRIDVARLARRFPALLEPLARGHLSLSVAALLKHHLTDQNDLALIAAVSGKTVAQAREVLATWFPRPDVPATIRKLPERRARVSATSEPVAPAPDGALFASIRAPENAEVACGSPQAPVCAASHRTATSYRPITDASATPTARSRPNANGMSAVTAREVIHPEFASASSSLEQVAVEHGATHRVAVERATWEHVAGQGLGEEHVVIGGAASERDAADRVAEAAVSTHDAADRAATQRVASQHDAFDRAAAQRVASEHDAPDPQRGETVAPGHAASELADGAAQRGAPDGVAGGVSVCGARPATHGRVAGAGSDGPCASPGGVLTNRASAIVEPLSAGRYRVQFTADGELKRKLELVRDLLRHAVPNGDLPTIIGRALDLLLDETLQRRFAKSNPRKGARATAASSAGNRPGMTTMGPASWAEEAHETSTPTAGSTAVATSPTRAESTSPTSCGTAPSGLEHAGPVRAPEVGVASAGAAAMAAKIPPRYLPSDVRRAVLERDGLRCTWVGPDGARCESRAWLEHDHIVPRGLGGSDDPQNIRIRCRAHNQLAAEQAYGEATIARIITARRAARRTSNADATPNAGRPAPT